MSYLQFTVEKQNPILQSKQGYSVSPERYFLLIPPPSLGREISLHLLPSSLREINFALEGFRAQSKN